MVMGRRRRLALAVLAEHRRPKQVVCPFEDIALPSRFREIVRLQGLADKRSPLIERGNSLWNPTPIVIDARPEAAGSDPDSPALPCRQLLPCITERGTVCVTETVQTRKNQTAPRKYRCVFNMITV